MSLSRISKAMVVDDSHVTRMAIMNMLKELGLNYVIQAGDGEIAWRMIKDAARNNDPFPLIIADITMPKMNGLTLLEEVRFHPKTKHTPFLFITARSRPSDVEEGLALGADGYIPKPFTKTELNSSLSRILNYA